MKVSEFRDAAIHSAQIYYQYLTDHGKGISSVGVREILALGHGAFSLHMTSRLSVNAATHLDELAFRFGGEDYTAY